MTQAALVEFDLAIRSRIDIAVAPALVWPPLMRLKEWKASVVSIERLAGEPDAEGETLRIGQRPADVTVHMIMRTVRVEPFAWRVQTLQAEDGRSTDGYVAYSLESLANGTRLSCDVIARCCVPAPDGAALDRIAFARRANESTKAKLDADHAALKRLIEALPR
jgi:hypothetical protein